MGKKPSSGRPTYGQALEAIGWYFDQQLYRGIFVAEVDDGYVGKARPMEDRAGTRTEGFTFPHSDVSALATAAAAGHALPDSAPPFCPEGYSVFMRAVGEMYDRNSASYVAVLEVANGFILSFTATSRDAGKPVRRRLLIDRAGIEELMNKAAV